MPSMAVCTNYRIKYVFELAHPSYTKYMHSGSVVGDGSQNTCQDTLSKKNLNMADGSLHLKSLAFLRSQASTHYPWIDSAVLLGTSITVTITCIVTHVSTLTPYHQCHRLILQTSKMLSILLESGQFFSLCKIFLFIVCVFVSLYCKRHCVSLYFRQNIAHGGLTQCSPP